MSYVAITANLTNGDATVHVPAGGVLANVSAGDMFHRVGVNVGYTVGSITDDTHFELSGNYNGTTESSAACQATTSVTPVLGLPYAEAGDQEQYAIVTEAIREIEDLLTGASTVPELLVGEANITGNATVGGTLAVTGVATFTAQPIMSSLTASRAVFTDASKGLVSNAITGTGNVVMSASPTLTGTVSAAALALSSTLAMSGNVALGANSIGRTTSTGGLTFDTSNNASFSANVAVTGALSSGQFTATSSEAASAPIVGINTNTGGAASGGIFSLPNSTTGTVIIGKTVTTGASSFYLLALQTGNGSAITTNKFLVDGAGNTTIAGTLGIGGNTSVTGNQTIGGTEVARATTQPTNAINILNGTAPVGAASGQTTLYTTSGELRVMDDAGNATLLSPHDEEYNWIHDCVKGSGEKVVYHMEKMARMLAEKHGDEFEQRFGHPFASAEKYHYTKDDITEAAKDHPRLAAFLNEWSLGAQ
jgi:hypothetical protein